MSSPRASSAVSTVPSGVEPTLRGVIPVVNRWAEWLLRALLALAFLWATASLWFPFGWDHGIMAAVGDVIVRGGMPYRDAWDMKGPLAFYVFAMAEWIFGRHMWAIRVVDLLLLGAGLVALARIVGRTTSSRMASWATVALVFWYGSLTWFFVSQPDGWVAMLMLIGVAPLAATATQPTFRAMAWCGLLIGCCSLIKPFYVAFLAVPGVFAVCAPATTARKIAGLGTAAGWALVPSLLAFAWFARQGALDSLIDVHIAYAAAYADSMRPDLIARRIFNYFWSNGVPTPAGAVAVVLPAIGLGASVLWQERRALGLALTTWLAIALGCVAIQGKFWFYQWVPAFPPFIVLGAVGLHRLATRDRVGSGGPLLAGISAGLFLLQVLAVPTVDVARWLAYITGVQSPTDYYSSYFRRNYVVANELEAAAYLRERTADSEAVLVWGNDATLTFLSGRPNATRFVFAMPLTRDVPGPFRPAYRQEYIASIRSRPPRYVVIGQPHDGSSDKDRDLRDFPELSSFIRLHYTLDRQIGFLDLYRRLD